MITTEQITTIEKLGYKYMAFGGHNFFKTIEETETTYNKIKIRITGDSIRVIRMIKGETPLGGTSAAGTIFETDNIDYLIEQRKNM